MLRKLVLALPLFFGLQGSVHAHSDASMFGAPVAAGEQHDHPVEAAVRYPATLIFDTRQLTNVVVKINARITR